MKNTIKLVVLAVAVMGMTACTQNERARGFGGNLTIDLPAGQKLVNVTWKEPSSIWYLTRPMRADEMPENYTFTEKSSFGVVQGKVILKESAAAK